MKAICQNCNREREVRRKSTYRVCNSCNCIINERKSTQYYLKTMMELDQNLGLYE